MHARPSVLPGQRYLRRPERVEFDVAQARQHVAVAVHKAGLEAPFPQRARASVALVEPSHLASPHQLHHPRHPTRLGGTDQKMHVIAHQHVGADLHVVLGRGERERLQPRNPRHRGMWPPGSRRVGDVGANGVRGHLRWNRGSRGAAHAQTGWSIEGPVDHRLEARGEPSARTWRMWPPGARGCSTRSPPLSGFC